MRLRIGILIVGSLFWDDSRNRSAWRQQCLDMNRSIRVRVPIRYGRRSSGRGNTYTMVFSRLCYRHTYGLGTGWIVPCRRSLRTFEDLVAEAERLAMAEGFKKGKLSAEWGCVGLLPHPEGSVPKPNLVAWRSRMRGEGSGPLSRPIRARSECPCISEDGILQLRWPSSSEGHVRANCEILLATPTQPSLTATRTYPHSMDIARAWIANRRGEERYFYSNVACGIRTFQDGRIWRVLRRDAVEWEESYPSAVRALEAELRFGEQSRKASYGSG